MTMTCYAVGSRIRTVRGEVAVEDLAVGDMVLTQQGDALIPEPVVWVGSGDTNLRTEAEPELVAPVRIRKDAIADGQPTSDLLVSPNHCVLIDGKLIPAGLLANGGSIVQDFRADHVHYFHVELNAHRIILAQGLPAESYLDTGNRTDFYVSSAVSEEITRRTADATPARWTTEGAAPLAMSVEEVEPVWKRLSERSTRLGYPTRAATTVPDANLFILADGKEIRAIEQNDRRAVFVLPAGTNTATLSSRWVIPRELPTFSTDTRRLGVAVRSISVSSSQGDFVIAADDPSLVNGWHPAENDGATTWRWTNGSAELPIRASATQTTVTIRFSAAPAYIVKDGVSRAA